MAGQREWLFREIKSANVCVRMEPDGKEQAVRRGCMLRPKPKEVKPFDNYLLLISFSNREDKIFDVKPMISGSWFGELQDRRIFDTVKISGNTVVWVNGQDICPDDLYYLRVPK